MHPLTLARFAQVCSVLGQLGDGHKNPATCAAVINVLPPEEGNTTWHKQQRGAQLQARSQTLCDSHGELQSDANGVFAQFRLYPSEDPTQWSPRQNSRRLAVLLQQNSSLLYSSAWWRQMLVLPHAGR